MNTMPHMGLEPAILKSTGRVATADGDLLDDLLDDLLNDLQNP